ncbi:MAG: glycosyltransferase family 2 protein [Chthoniobacter sp.]|uniref:glycosyltransferase family 2 protein n=1 Tax=Chthoniobacter sp. TaxID=2510640 RepID=UPI0032A3FD95
MNASVAALIATYRRPAELRRLLHSLALSGSSLTTVIVVDNDGSDEGRALVEAAFPGAQYVNPGANLGCGGGLRMAEEEALRSGAGDFTHLLILDDDAVLVPDVLPRLLEAMEREEADLACPLVVNERGLVGWLPGLPRGMRHANGLTPEEFRQRFGGQPHRFAWAQGICLLVSRRAIERCGLHRGDFWVRGEDLEFSLRLTAQGCGILVPAVTVQHRPPPESTGVSREAEYWKHCALVQNNAYIGFRLSHGHRIAWTIAGTLRHFFGIWSWGAFGDAVRALWRGAVLGEPAGARSGPTFRARAAALRSS